MADDTQDLLRLADETPTGGFACPICGEEKPHHHTAPVVDAYQNKRSRK